MGVVMIAILLGIGFGVLLGRVALGGVLAVAFSRARRYVQRVTERRHAAQAVAANRRHAERRAS